tara:strand:+ start:598 stop:885 length:288 start_codon:yes stop_codon:yes gene_type:complete
VFSKVVATEFLTVDLLFNNAGVSLIDSVENQSLDDFHWLMNINFGGIVHGTNTFYRSLKNYQQLILLMFQAYLAYYRYPCKVLIPITLLDADFNT